MVEIIVKTLNQFRPPAHKGRSIIIKIQEDKK
jgi:hypothetical protein